MINAAFQWKCHPGAEALLVNFLDQACQANAFIEELKIDLEKHTSSRLFDWLDYLEVSCYSGLDAELEGLGFKEERAAPNYRIFRHPGAQLPRLVVRDSKSRDLRDKEASVLGVAVGVGKNFRFFNGARDVWLDRRLALQPFSPLLYIYR